MSRGGFTLAEVLVAMSILMVVMLGTGAMLGYQLAGSAGNHDRVMAASVAQGRLDQLMRIPFAALSSHLAPVATTVPGTPRTFATVWRATPAGGVTPITVTTTWSDGAGQHSVVVDGGRAR